MRIAMVSEHASPLATLGGVDAGGQNVHVAALSEALGRLGHRVVVYTRRDDPSLPPAVPLCPGVTVEHIDAGPPQPVPKDEMFPYMAEMADRIGRRWRRVRPDVVHSHFWMSGLAALQAAHPYRIPVVHTFHALGTVKRRHQGARDTSPAARLPGEAAIVRHSHRIVATCTDELFELVRLGADAHRVSVVPCGVDTALFDPQGPAPRRMGRLRLVSIGRLVERKGIDDAIRALAELPEAELIVAGGPDRGDLGRDPDAMRLAVLARRCGVADRVVLTGRVGRAAVPPLLRSADVAVCVPWYEPFGIVPLEAMSCAVPVVASNVGGLTDTVVHGVTGLHVPPRSPSELARALRSLLDDPDRRSRMGAAGRARVVERFRWETVARGTLTAYRRALSDPARQHAVAPATDVSPAEAAGLGLARLGATTLGTSPFDIAVQR